MSDDPAAEAVAAYFHASRSQGKRRKPNPVADAIVNLARKRKSSRHIYILNTETGERSAHVDVSDMKPARIVTEEARLWAMIEGEAFVVRDSAND